MAKNQNGNSVRIAVLICKKYYNRADIEIQAVTELLVRFQCGLYNDV